MMETEIDPLSMLEQTMQVNEYSVTSNGDGDVVCLNDETESSMEYFQSSSYSHTGVAEPSNIAIEQDQSLMIQPHEAMGFGEHFLLNANTADEEAASVQTDPPPLLTIKNGKVLNGRSRTKMVRAVKSPKSRRSRSDPPLIVQQLQSLVCKPNVIQLKKNESSSDNASMPRTEANNKLVNNVKRLSFASSEEQEYRFKIYNDLQKVLKSRLDCTVCGCHIGCNIDLNVFLVTHPLLKVLACLKCRNKYCNTDWTLGPENRDVRCRWCSKPSSKRAILKNCSNCPFAFCEECMVRNYSKRDSNKIVGNATWLCYVCQMVPLYFMRATCWALHMFIASLKRRKNRDSFKKDMSECCKGKSLKTIEIEEEDELLFSSQVPVVETVSCLSISSRIDILFSGIENIKKCVKARLSPQVEIDKLDELVSDINFSLAKIGRNVESCLDFIENWRFHSIEVHKKQEEKKRQLRQGPPNGPTVVNGVADYSYLLKKFNIQPCSVVLERLETTSLKEETSEPPNFFFSLIPKTAEEINVIDDDDDDANFVYDDDDDDDDSIICLDDD